MTKDHIVPKSCGGEDADGNFQTMCAVCNNLKSNYDLGIDKVRRLRASLDAGADRPTLGRMARRMAMDDGSPPMTAGELAAALMRRPDDAVAIDTGGDGMEPLRAARPASKGPLDSGSLPDRFVALHGPGGGWWTQREGGVTGTSCTDAGPEDGKCQECGGTGRKAREYDVRPGTEILCKPCYDAISAAVLASDLVEGTGIKGISIESALKFATDFKYACKHSRDYASHRCMGGDCRCMCHMFR
jgi:hypothetical protein